MYFCIKIQHTIYILKPTVVVSDTRCEMLPSAGQTTDKQHELCPNIIKLKRLLNIYLIIANEDHIITNIITSRSNPSSVTSYFVLYCLYVCVYMTINLISFQVLSGLLLKC